MTEAELQSLITDAATAYGWIWHHETDSRRSPAGFPDLVMVRGRHVLFMELKSERGRLSVEQLGWTTALERVDTIATAVVRPADADAVLERLARHD